MPLGTEVGLGPGHNVLDGDQVPGDQETCCAPFHPWKGAQQPPTSSKTKFLLIRLKLEMWANAQRDGRPAEHRWRPLFNAAKFG